MGRKSFTGDKGLRLFVAVVLTLLFVSLLSACNVLGNSKVRSGQLVTTGDARYDAYFKSVHHLQAASAKWNDERSASRKPLTQLLDLKDGASSAAIAEATQQRLSPVAREVGPTTLDTNVSTDPHVAATNPSNVDPATQSLFQTIESTTRSELSHIKELEDVSPKTEELTHTGKDLSPRVRVDFAKDGGQKVLQVKEDVDASIDVLETIDRRAKSEARERKEFIASLQRAVAAGTDASGNPSSDPAKPSAEASKREKKRASGIPKSTKSTHHVSPQKRVEPEATPIPKAEVASPKPTKHQSEKPPASNDVFNP